jgi:hypothetical protein
MEYITKKKVSKKLDRILNLEKSETVRVLNYKTDKSYAWAMDKTGKEGFVAKSDIEANEYAEWFVDGTKLEQIEESLIKDHIGAFKIYTKGKETNVSFWLALNCKEGIEHFKISIDEGGKFCFCGTRYFSLNEMINDIAKEYRPDNFLTTSEKNKLMDFTKKNSKSFQKDLAKIIMKNEKMEDDPMFSLNIMKLKQSSIMLLKDFLESKGHSELLLFSVEEKMNYFKYKRKTGNQKPKKRMPDYLTDPTPAKQTNNPKSTSAAAAALATTVSPPAWPCQTCQQTFSNRDSLRRHNSKFHK